MNTFIENIKPNFLDKNNKISSSRLLWFFRKNSTEKQQLFDLTPNCHGEENFRERIFWLENDLSGYLQCANPDCDNDLTGITRWTVSKEDIDWNTDNHRLTCCKPCRNALHSSRKKEVHKKRVKVMKDRYGVEAAAHLDTNLFKSKNPMKDKKIVNKVKETCLKKYGVDNVSKSDEIIEKIKMKAARPLHEQQEINRKREETCLEKYGVTNSAKLSETQEKYKETCLRKYGVEHVSQDTNTFEKMNRHGYAAKDYTFPSGKIVRIRGYEWKALDELLLEYDESELIVETKKIPKIKYQQEDGSEHYYYPDIYIPKNNLIIEVKSDYTMKIDYDKNMRKKTATQSLGYGFKFMIYSK